MKTVVFAAALVLTWAGSAEAQPPAPSAAQPITPPEWLHKPTLDAYSATYPMGAASRGYDGEAIIHCTVNVQGLLKDCSILKETPEGYGLGQAALTLAPTMLFKPGTRDGKPVETEVSIPIYYGSDLGMAGISQPRILGTPVWSKTPDVADILSEIDKKVGDKYAEGKVVLQCDVNNADGKLKGCKLINASPGMTQFQDVAKSLAQKFQADRKQLSPGTHVRVYLPFSFPDMASPAWNGRHLTHVQWSRLLTPTPGRPLFPDAAVEAGLKSGSALVDCLVADDGGLSDCKVVKESAPNVGLGDMAKTIAEASAIDPWTDEGLPAGGARVELPFKMTYDEKLAAPAPTPSTKP